MPEVVHKLKFFEKLVQLSFRGQEMLPFELLDQKFYAKPRACEALVLLGSPCFQRLLEGSLELAVSGLNFVLVYWCLFVNLEFIKADQKLE